MVKWFALISALVASPSIAQVQPWSETVVSVQDIKTATHLFREVGGWTVRERGKVARAELDYWKLPAAASATFERLCAPKTETGCLRFVSFKGVAQKPIRLATRAWDTGGIYSVMVRSDNVPALYDAAIKMGWWAESRPIRFKFGASDLRNVVLVGPHGINLAVYERVSPPFTAFPVGRISQGFNSMRMVRDKRAALQFYLGALGFNLVFDSPGGVTEPTYSNFGVPINYTVKVQRSAAALNPMPGETGRIEVMQIDGFTGLDVSADAVPPNLGILSVRFPVKGLDSYREALKERGVATIYEGTNVTIAGLGKVNIFAVRDPDGNISEFYERNK
jgi:catechol 2,3-dioxygenase-like lactoylglutathione lyase family enzyme